MTLHNIGGNTLENPSFIETSTNANKLNTRGKTP